MYWHNPFFSPCGPCQPFPQQICCTTIFFPMQQQPVYTAPAPVKPTYVQPISSNQPNLPNQPNVPNQPNMYGRMF